MSVPAVGFEGVSKRFTIYHERARSFQDLLVQRFRPSANREEFWALRDVTLSVEPGRALGIVGSNGSGKSTLLKLVTRILAPTSGVVTVNGRVSALLELGAGFHPELSGRDNIFLNSSILGLARRKVAERLDSIVGFAELERFIDIPVKHYSSGMYARLGFAVAINVDPDVLLIDEVLSVGDEAFQERCLDAIHSFHRAGKTLLLVSHDLAAIKALCTEAIWLDQGTVRARGDPAGVVESYRAAAHAGPGVEAHSFAADSPSLTRWGSGEAEILHVAVVDSAGAQRSVFQTGESLAICLRYLAHQRIEAPVFGIAIKRGDGVLVAGPNTRAAGYSIESIEGHGLITYAVDCLPLLPGRYSVAAAIYDHTCTHPFYHCEEAEAFEVTTDHEWAEPHGVVRLSGAWSHSS